MAENVGHPSKKKFTFPNEMINDHRRLYINGKHKYVYSKCKYHIEFGGAPVPLTQMTQTAQTAHS